MGQQADATTELLAGLVETCELRIGASVARRVAIAWANGATGGSTNATRTPLKTVQP